MYLLCRLPLYIINTAERKGGAAIAANRLMKALSRNGVEAKMLVRDLNNYEIFKQIFIFKCTCYVAYPCILF